MGRLDDHRVETARVLAVCQEERPVGETDRALPIFKKVFEADESWRELIPRLVDSDLMPDDDALILQITNQ